MLVCVCVCVCVCVFVCVSLCFPSLQIQRFKVVQPGAHAAAYKDELFDPRLKRVIVSNFIPALSSSELIPVLLTRCMLGCTELVSNLVLVLLVLLSSSKNSQCKHATTVDQLCVLQLRKHSKISSIFRRNLDAAVHAFVCDYCNSLFTCLSRHRSQLVQNTAARFLTPSTKRGHNTPTLASLHWLTVSFRIDLKILLLNFKARSGPIGTYTLTTYVLRNF